MDVQNAEALAIILPLFALAAGFVLGMKVSDWNHERRR